MYRDFKIHLWNYNSIAIIQQHLNQYCAINLEIADLWPCWLCRTVSNETAEGVIWSSTKSEVCNLYVDRIIFRCCWNDGTLQFLYLQSRTAHELKITWAELCETSVLYSANEYSIFHINHEMVSLFTQLTKGCMKHCFHFFFFYIFSALHGQL